MLEVIGAGFGRTGTLSLKTALDQLGYKTHHMREVMQDPQQDVLWLQAARDQEAGRPTNWGAVFGPGGYTAAVDWPAARFYKELLAAHPKAKVILTVRESFDRWYDSVMQTILLAGEASRSVRPPPYLAPFFRRLTAHSAMVDAVIWSGTFGGRIRDREFAKQVYEAHIAEVQAAVPPEQLLLFTPRDGWAPLCAFLGVAAPAGEPFPHVNDKETFGERLLGGRMRRVVLYRRLIGACNAAVAAAAAAAGGLLVARLLRRRGRRARG